MPFLTASGIKKLTELRAQVQSIFDQKYENKNHSSKYSKEMAINVIEIIDYILKINNTSISSTKEFEKLSSPI